MGKTIRSGQFQETVVRAERDAELIDDVLEGKARAGVARETDEVVPLKDVSLADQIDPTTIEEFDDDELARKAAESSAQFQNHYLVWQDGYAVCNSCPHQHTIPLDPNKFDLIDGRPVKKPALAKITKPTVK